MTCANVASQCCGAGSGGFEPKLLNAAERLNVKLEGFAGPFD